MKQASLFLLLFLLVLSPALSQEHSMALSPEWHQERREQLRQAMPDHSVAVFFANPVRNRANDVDYHYHQDPDLYYLSGYREPHGALLIFKEDQDLPNGARGNEALFVQPRNQEEEMWDGKRLGVEGAKNQLGFSHVYASEDFLELKLDEQALQNILFLHFHDDIRRDPSREVDLFSMVEHFKSIADYDENLDEYSLQLYALIKEYGSEPAAFERLESLLKQMLSTYPHLEEDELIEGFLSATDHEERLKHIEKIPSSRLLLGQLDELMNHLREIKTPEEILLLRRAIDISAIGQIEVMKAMKPGLSELEIQGIHEFVYRKYGAAFEGYPSIVGSGHNGCILHYIENSRPKVENDLVLMDLGAEFLGYTADVTRTIPGSGTFSKEQKQIYDLVYEAQEAAFKACRPGAAFGAPDQAARKVINEGLKKLGITKLANSQHSYFPHGTSHYLGLDVHDRGNYGPLRAGMVITVEPGIYIPEGSDCPKKWWGIAVRIEDDVLITEEGYENLSKRAPRRSEEIEKVMAEPSPLDAFVLPELE